MVYISHMIRTQVYLPRTLYQQVQLVAKKDNKPAAQVVRELLTESLEQRSGSIGKALLELTKIRGKGPADLSTKIDKYLYE